MAGEKPPKAAKAKGACRMADIAPDWLAALNDGHVQTRTLTEGLAMDFVHLMGVLYPHLAPESLRDAGGITRRMAAAGQMIWEDRGWEDLPRLRSHASDTVRGWAAYLIAARPGLPLHQRLEAARPLADDPHFGVREWVWLALRPHLLPDMAQAIALLQPWVQEASPYLRRFASEITRPRGVWCSSSPLLRQNPDLGLPLLEPLKTDPDGYVQDSVANWLNDAGKDQPDWLRRLAERWQAVDHPATRRILKRGLRRLPDAS